MQQNVPKRRSLFLENNVGSTYTDLLDTEIEEYRAAKNQIKEEYNACILRNKQKITEMKNKITIDSLSRERQEFLNTLPDINAYINIANKFLENFEIYKENLEMMKTAVDKIPSKILR